MCGVKYGVRLAVIALIVQTGQLISTDSRNRTAEILWNLSYMAVQNKQPQARLSDYQLYPERFSKYTGNNVQLEPKAGTRFKQQDQHYSNYLNSYPSQYTNYPYYQTYPYYPNRGVQNSGHQPQSFSQVLDMLSRNDERQCVPRLLCEMLSNSNQSQDLKLPFNVNLDGLSGLLPTIAGVANSPVLTFGTAALLGYSSKGKPDSCASAYPQCPKDADELLEYLNNYNGGVFRYFSGVNQLQQSNPYYSNPYRPSKRLRKKPQYGQRRTEKPEAERRILTTPISEYGYGEAQRQQGLRFPSPVEDINTNYLRYEAPTRTVVFPGSLDFRQDRRERHQKALSFPEDNFRQLKKQNYHGFMIFPDRTGTGELRLDAEELKNNRYNYNANSYRYL